MSLLTLDDVEHHLAPDTILPAQFFGQRQEFSPEHRLWLDILMDAIRTVQRRECVPGGSDDRTPHKSRQIWADAVEWFADTAVYIGSFQYVCEIFDLDADWFRDRLRTAKRAPRNNYLQGKGNNRLVDTEAMRERINRNRARLRANA